MNEFENMMQQLTEAGRKVCNLVAQKVEAYSALIDETNVKYAEKSNDELQTIANDRAYRWTQRAIAEKILKERENANVLVDNQ